MSFHGKSVCFITVKRRNSSSALIPWQLTSRERAIREAGGSGRIALFILKKASLTVEAAVVLPLFLLGITMLLGVIDICRVKVESQAELTQQAKELSMYAYGTPGLYENEYVDLFKTESYELPVQLFPFGEIKIALRGRVHTWTGRSDSDDESAIGSGLDSEMVYVSERETVYHTDSSCTHLNLSIFQVEKSQLEELRNDSGGKYYPCEKCCGKNTDCSWYFVTEIGNVYHSSENCSSLKRSIKLVRKEEVSQLDWCERCEEKQK